LPHQFVLFTLYFEIRQKSMNPSILNPMKTYTILHSLSLLVAMTGLLLSGCSKSFDNVTPTGENEQGSGDLKAGKAYTAVGTVYGTSGVVFGTYRYGTSLTAENYVTIKVNVTTIGTYYITSNTFNGYSFSKSGSFTSTGIQYITLQGNGSPIAPSINTFIVNFGSSCVFKVVVVYKNPIVQTSCNTSYTYYEVANHKTLKVWLDRNLGASQVAQSVTDFQAYGSLFQWGRAADGHQCISWIDNETGTPVNGTTYTTSSSNTPGHSLFIKTVSSPADWRVPQNNTLWGSSGTNNPCPTGFRIPTSAELNSERVSWNSQNAGGAFGSMLKLTMPGYREGDGNIYESGEATGYWSSTVSGTNATILWVETTGAFTLNEDRGIGYSVRCIKN